MNGASEQTLADLLATAQAMNVNLIKLQQLIKSGGVSSGSSSGTGSATGSVAGVVSSLNPIGIAFGVLKSAASAVGTVFGVLGSILGKVVTSFTQTASSLYSFAASTALGTSKLSDFYAAFQNLPIIGTAFGIISDVLRYQEQLLEFFQQISFVGAGFSGSLGDMRMAATRTYMSMQDFAAVVKENAEVFSTLGGTVMTGINKFVDIQNKMLGPKSEYGNIMNGLGYTAKETGNMIAYYMKMQGASFRQQLQSDDEIIKGTIAYAKELDLLSQLTGKNSADLRKKAEKIQAEEAFEVFKMDKNKNQILAMDTAITNMIATNGEDAAVQLKNAFMGLNVAQSEGQIAQVMMTRNGSTMLNDLIVRMVAQGKTSEEIGAAVRKGNLENAKIATTSIENFGITAATMQNNILLTSNAGYIKLLKDQKSVDNLNQNEREARARQIKAQASQAAALERASQGIKDFGNQLLMTVWGVIAPMAPLLQEFAGWIASLVVDLAALAAKLTGTDGFKDALNGIVKWFRKTFETLGTSTNAGDFFNKLGDRMGVAFEAIKPALVSIFEKFINFFKPYAIDMLHTIEDYMNAVMFQKTGKAFGAEDPEVRKKQRAYEKLELAAQALSERAALLGGGGNNAEEARQLSSEAKRKMEEALAAKAIWQTAADKGKGQARVAADSPFSRHSGTIGMTGNWWEKSDATLNVQAGESVVTQSQMDQIVNTASQSGMAQSIQQLNSLTAQMLSVMKQNAENTKRTYEATRALNGDLFQIA